jgi:hypothetical protein
MIKQLARDQSLTYNRSHQEWLQVLEEVGVGNAARVPLALVVGVVNQGWTPLALVARVLNQRTHPIAATGGTLAQRVGNQRRFPLSIHVNIPAKT